MSAAKPLSDRFGRVVTYLRLSVTDRCDLRCSYCMSERMVFLPRAEVLDFDELRCLAGAFIRRGVRRVRITGGEPLVRRDVIPGLIEPLSEHLARDELDEITVTTNGTQLERLAYALVRAGVRRVNVSLDSLDPQVYRRITRGGDVDRVIGGIGAAVDAGLAVKVNTVVLRRDNLAEIPRMISWSHERGLSITLIEVMPMAETGYDRLDQYAPLSGLRSYLESIWRLEPLCERTGGPARYVRVEQTGGKLGFITPLTGNFCEGCNRVRVTCTGVLHSCLGHEAGADLRAVIRDSVAGDEGFEERLDAALDEALAGKPKGHEFVFSGQSGKGGVIGGVVGRHMSVTGG